MILPRRENVPLQTTGGLETVGVRCPDHPVTRAIIEAAGVPVAAPSGNTSGRPSPTTAGHMAEDMDGKIEGMFDGVPCAVGVELTIIDLSCTPPRLLRPGGLPLEALEAVLGHVVVDKAFVSLLKDGERPKAPGMKYRHYAPRADLTIVEGPSDKVVETMNRLAAEAEESGKKVGMIATDETKSRYPHGIVMSLGARSNEEEIAQHLFEVLRKFDDTDVDCIFSESFEDAAIGAAIMNRLLKAAGHKVVRV